MPYVPQEVRRGIKPVFRRVPESSGELNYQITCLMLDYMTAHNLNYQTINDIMGAAEGAKQEFYRRVAIPYENHKIDLNGDVYE